MAGSPMSDLVPDVKPGNIANRQVGYTGAELVHRRVSVKGSDGVFATVVITVQQEWLWMSIQCHSPGKPSWNPGKLRS